MLTVVILTRDEERHIARAIGSVTGIAERIFVADSGSTDRTVAIAEELGAEVRFNPWRNYATQFNWALDQLPEDTEWVLRLDADRSSPQSWPGNRYAAGRAGSGHRRRMDLAQDDVPRAHDPLGAACSRCACCACSATATASCENRWMDEHVLVSGPTADFSGEIVDDNLNSLTWWTAKHNAYASREVVDLLNLRHHFMPHETMADLRSGKQAGIKRWIKEHLYAHLPGGSRAFIYFSYRYIIRLGFLDGREGAAFHALQGFWYRFLVDAKLFEVERHMQRHGTDAPAAIKAVLGIDVNPGQNS